MFRALLVHPQEALHKRHLVYCVRIMSAGCGTVAVKLRVVEFITLLLKIIINCTSNIKCYVLMLH
jgi:hypothetical protein